ncbi:hypothetical protein GCM10010274_20980 [Streptomyces lavendofoliae]|uniref:Uncharacterized protein n=1 Tax=Streptomyces lavendofoliae TaxID=67314 RepID=A0A918HXA1_9ACTN|nr:hypothetical protein GCM10010274_20980 [Streptomyces lavendofoliae]
MRYGRVVTDTAHILPDESRLHRAHPAECRARHRQGRMSGGTRVGRGACWRGGPAWDGRRARRGAAGRPSSPGDPRKGRPWAAGRLRATKTSPPHHRAVTRTAGGAA